MTPGARQKRSPWRSCVTRRARHQCTSCRCGGVCYASLQGLVEASPKAVGVYLVYQRSNLWLFRPGCVAQPRLPYTMKLNTGQMAGGMSGTDRRDRR